MSIGVSKPPSKMEKAAVVAVCEALRRFFGMAHWLVEIEWPDEDDTSEDGQPASAARIASQDGCRFSMEVFPRFFDESGHRRLFNLIHEHIHAVFQTQWQAVRAVVQGYVPPGLRDGVMDELSRADEFATDHMTGAIFLEVTAWLERQNASLTPDRKKGKP